MPDRFAQLAHRRLFPWPDLWTLGAVLIAAVVLAPILSIAWIALTNSWAAEGSFFVTLGFGGSYPLLLVPIAIGALLGYVALRRATARS